MHKLKVEDIIDMDEKVLQWNLIGGNDPLDTSLIETYVNLSREEGAEGGFAANNEDKPEEIDALADSIFTGFFLNRLIMGQGYSKDWLSTIVGSHHSQTTSWEEMLKALDNNQYQHYSTLLAYKVIELSEKYDIIAAFQRVAESNYSKYLKFTDEIDITKEFDYIENQGRYTDLFYERTGDYVAIKAGKDLREGVEYPKGKIVKSTLFKSVEDLGGLEEFVL